MDPVKILAAIVLLAGHFEAATVWQRVHNPDDEPVVVETEIRPPGAEWGQVRVLCPPVIPPGMTCYLPFLRIAPDQAIRARSCQPAEPAVCSEPSNVRVIP